MSNLTSLADEYVAAKLVLEAAEAKVRALRKEILSTGYEEIIGEHKIVKVNLYERTDLKAEEVRKILTADQLKACVKVTLIESLLVKDKPLEV